MSAPEQLGPGNGNGSAADKGEALEIIARFAQSASTDAPRGVLLLEGRDAPIAFAGWLDLMAIVEGLLQEARDDSA